VQLLILIADYILERASTFSLFAKLQLSLMTHLVSHVKFINSVIKVTLSSLVLFLNLIVLDVECAMIQVKLFKVDLKLPELCLELVYSLLSFLLDLAEPNDLSHALLKL